MTSMNSDSPASVGTDLKPHMLSRNVERTLNAKGFMFTEIGPSASHWLSTPPSVAQYPLLDLGAAYGVHTLHALRNGRNVIALDADERHLTILRERVEKEAAKGSGSEGMGRLLRTVEAQLPDREAVGEEEVGSVLLAEVMHFLVPKEAMQLFHDIWYWLGPGGKFVSTSCASMPGWNSIREKGFNLQETRTKEEVEELLKGSDEDVAVGGYGFALLGEDLRPILGDHFYFLSVEEVGAMARLAGFEVQKCEYIATGKYQDDKTSVILDNVLLVARKPDLPRRN